MPERPPLEPRRGGSRALRRALPPRTIPSISTSGAISAASAASSDAPGAETRAPAGRPGGRSSPSSAAQQRGGRREAACRRRRTPSARPRASAVVVDRVLIRRCSPTAVPTYASSSSSLMGVGPRSSGCRSQPPRAFLLELRDGAEREVQDLDRMPGRRGSSPAPRHCGFRAPSRRQRVSAMGDLLVGVEDRLLVAGMGGSGEADDHPLGEERAVVGPRQEVSPAAADDAEPVGDRRQHVLQRAPARPPELVRVRVDHPVRAVLGGGQARHPRDPLVLPHVVARLPHEPQDARRARTARVSRSSRRSMRCPSRSRSRRPRGGERRPARRRCLPRRERAASSRPSQRTVPRVPRHAASTTRSAARPSTTTDDLLHDPPPFRRRARPGTRARAGHRRRCPRSARRGRKPRTPRAPRSACRRRSSPPTTPPAARPRRTARTPRDGHRRARRGGSCPRCRRPHRRARAASRGRRGR